MARLLSICNKTLRVMHTLIGSKCSIRIRNHYNNMQEERRNPRARLSHEMRKYVGLTGHEQEIRLLLSEHCLPIHPLCLSSHLPPILCFALTPKSYHSEPRTASFVSVSINVPCLWFWSFIIGYPEQTATSQIKYLACGWMFQQGLVLSLK